MNRHSWHLWSLLGFVSCAGLSLPSRQDAGDGAFDDGGTTVILTPDGGTTRFVTSDGGSGATGGGFTYRFFPIPIQSFGKVDASVIALTKRADTVWALQSNGEVLRFDGTTFTAAFDLATPATGLAVTDDAIFVATGNKLMRCALPCTDAAAFVADNALDTGDSFVSMCGSATAAYALAGAGAGSYLYTRTGASGWSRLKLPISYAKSCTLGERGELYALGDEGLVRQHDGQSVFESLGSGERAYSLVAVGGELQVTGWYYVYRRSEGARGAVFTSLYWLRGGLIAGTTANDLFVVGSDSHTDWHHWSGTAWREGTGYVGLSNRKVLLAAGSGEYFIGGDASRTAAVIRVQREGAK